MPKETNGFDFEKVIKEQLKGINSLTDLCKDKLQDLNILKDIEKKQLKNGSASRLINNRILIEFNSEKEQKAFYDKLK